MYYTAFAFLIHSFIYLNVSKTEISQKQFNSINACNSWSWLRLTLAAKNSIQILQMGDRAHCLLPPRKREELERCGLELRHSKMGDRCPSDLPARQHPSL